MERVVKYVNDIFKQAGNSAEVKNQKEELIASLHDRIYDAMASGKSEDQAFDHAVSKLGDLSELTELLDGSHRTIFVNRLSLHQGLIAYAIIVLELVISGGLYMALPMSGKSPDAQQAMLMSLACALVASSIWPIAAAFAYYKKPNRVEKSEFNFRKQITIALVVSLAVSIAVIFINLKVIAFTADLAIWFWWPVLGIANWPLSLFIYNWLYKMKRYEA
jgi:hypothetical protein